ncbi:16S rRNA (guanine(527)-N(7))-methyltransferase RsmG [Kovacikia minuta]|uniref:16S rRNA (guanine(527)-N(7))-methyltransferase RsmG n=1 Tax=Kovacikia minuta TaxID=2931930 RepID=UPI001CED42E0|nr:16S rRNA (guanine(527)-N(7))-methyltransferase RsmG [Kovacikia minuta]
MNQNQPSQTPALPEMPELWQQTLGWQPTPIQQAQFQQLYEQVLAGNRQFNLTRITDPAEFWEKHLWDSLRGVRRFLEKAEGSTQHLDSIQNSKFKIQNSPPHTSHPTPHTPHPTSYTVIDIGTGAGFPGMAVAIAQPTWNLTLLDATRKKIQFLDHLLDFLEIPNGRTWVDRAESVGQNPNHRQSYDVALVRAVAAAPICAEYALPLVKIGGTAVLYRGQWTDSETIALEPVVNHLGGTIEAIEAFKTPLTGGDRHCLYLKKIAPTPPEFPRADRHSNPKTTWRSQC